MSGSRVAALVGLLSVLALPVSAHAAKSPSWTITPERLVRVVAIHYRAHDGLSRRAYVIVPRWYGAAKHPALPLVISPHGRGVSALTNVARWGNLPALGGFAVVNPEGQGRRFALFSWGDPGEIRDLARMPTIVHRALPWLRIDRRRIYAFGGSMGGQETLLLVAKYPRLLAGAASFDAPTNIAARYNAFEHLQWGDGLQSLARREIGGTPSSDPHAYAIRSPLAWARQIAFSGVPLQIWWSTRDDIVTDQVHESGLLYRDIKRLNPDAPVTQYVGTWAHTTEMHWHGDLPYSLAQFGLMPTAGISLPGLVRAPHRQPQAPGATA